MPERIKLFPTYYTVKDTEKDESATYKGRVDHGGREIRVDSRLHSEDAKTTLLHEINHCIADMAGGKIEENLADIMANGFLSIIRGNKELLKWLEEVE